MAHYLQDTTELIAYIQRKMGGEIHEIEITPTQWVDILEDSKYWLFDYSDFGTYDQWEIVEPNGASTIELSADVVGIRECYGMNDIANIPNFAYPIDSLYYTVIRDGAATFSISSFVVMRQYLNTFRDLFREPVVFNFNNDSKRLEFPNSNYKSIGFLLIKEENVDKLVNNKFFKMLVEAHAWQQWSVNIAGKYDVSKASILGNGLTLNSDSMQDRADKLFMEIKEGLENEEFGTLLMPKRLYN